MFAEQIPMAMEREFGLPEHIPMVAVGFGLMPEQNAKKSAKAGHPVFDDIEYVQIAVPGDKQSVYFQPATDAHKKRFPRAYEAFKQREIRPVIEGFPIEQWPQISRAVALTLKAAHIMTVEALANVHDGHIDKLGSNGRELRAKAQAFMAVAKDTAEAQKIAAENVRLHQQLAEMQRQITDLAGRLQSDEGRRGRPRKDEAA